MARMNSVNRTTVKLAGIFGCITLVASSCATRGDFRALQTAMHEQASRAEYRLSSIEGSVALLDSLLREQSRNVLSLRAIIGTQAQEQRDDIAIIMARQDDINYQLRELSETLQAIQLYGGVELNAPQQNVPGTVSRQPVSAPSITATPPAIPTEPALPAQQQAAAESAEFDGTAALELYESALTDLNDENFLLAESLFLSFLMQYPTHELASNAQYWLGEAAYGQGKHDLAVSEFRKVIGTYPESDRIPGALLRIGEIQMERGDMRGGAETLNQLITSYPDSDETTIARGQLNAH